MNSKELRIALSKFATGITVITTVDKDNNPIGVTVNSFTSVSLDPPLVLWCLGDQTFALQAFLNSNRFVVNILSVEQEQISNNFAFPGDFDRFADISYERGIGNVPLINNCLANLQCTRSNIERVGDHWVFISQIDIFNINEGNPLVYYSSNYQKFA